MEFSDIKRIFADEAAKREIEEYELYYSSETSVSTETLKDEISAFASGTARGICFRCKVDGKIGYAATELFEEDEARRAKEAEAEEAAIALEETAEENETVAEDVAEDVPTATEESVL